MLLLVRSFDHKLFFGVMLDTFHVVNGLKYLFDTYLVVEYVLCV